MATAPAPGPSENADLVAAIVEYSDDAIVSMTLDGLITSWNPAAERLYGHAAAEVVGRSFGFLIPESRAGEMMDVLTWVSQGQTIKDSLHSELPRKDGTLVPIWITISPIRNEDGEVVGLVSIHHDVTEQRMAFESAQRIAAIIEDSEDAILSGSLDGTTLSFNPAAEAMFGYLAEEVIGQPGDILLPADQKGEVKAVLAQLKAGQHVKDVDAIRVRKDGTAFPISLTASPIRDADGEVVGTSVIYRDVTAQKKALETARRMAAVVESSGEAITSSSLEGIITSWNPAAEKLYGYSSEEMIGKSASLLAPPRRAGELVDILVKVRAVRHLETRLVRKNGKTVSVSMTIAPIYDADGAIVGVSSIARDAAPSRKARRGLERMLSLLGSSSAALSGETDAIVGATSDGIVTSWNPGAEKMLGYSSEEIIGKSVTMMVPQDRLHEVAAFRAKVMAGEGVESFESVRLRKDGTTFPVLLALTPIMDADGTVVGVSIIMRDLTERDRYRRDVELWRDKAFKWMEELERFQRRSVEREFERELQVIDLQQEIEDLKHLLPQSRVEPDDEPGAER